MKKIWLGTSLMLGLLAYTAGCAQNARLGNSGQWTGQYFGDVGVVGKNETVAAKLETGRYNVLVSGLMTADELKRWLKKQGCEFTEIPRHPSVEIKTGTYSAILKKLGLKK